jgi:hypothetical protein
VALVSAQARKFHTIKLGEIVPDPWAHLDQRKSCSPRIALKLSDTR